jgi:hypothetical protein
VGLLAAHDLAEHFDAAAVELGAGADSVPADSVMPMLTARRPQAALVSWSSARATASACQLLRPRSSAMNSLPPVR